MNEIGISIILESFIVQTRSLVPSTTDFPAISALQKKKQNKTNSQRQTDSHAYMHK